ncbi:hypothetical protein VSH64_16830 [Amycolatopsis rhabdoformis]|uniref:Secreted protein n=1 Tax=Amycolatopsis rhabdoformis TaxID=1448059 RepID=A0ABZ1IIH6_9PSEU|nr:hypothetical protein [Amycolatopsis rhabdoformis]WSE33752.1 hypothetical protein VSH64_16830 [Amycolatopsis rhabdoformis]
MKKPLGRLAGAVLAGAALTLASAPAAFAQDDPTAGADTTVTTESSETTDATAPATSDSSTAGAPTSDTATAPTSEAPTSDSPSSDSPFSDSPSSTAGIETPGQTEVQTTEGRRAPAAAQPRIAADGQDGDQADDTTSSTAPADPYTDNAGHGFVGLGGEGVLVIACAAGAPGNVATVGLTVTAGPDQDGADGRYWNYDVRVTDPATAPTAPFSWTCDGVPGQGDVTFEQETPPTSDTPTTGETPTSSETPSGTSSSAAPITTSSGATATSTSTAGAAVTRPTVQVRYAPQGGVETGFGGTARFWS